jgi:AcrR family transcriptional regulator
MIAPHFPRKSPRQDRSRVTVDAVVTAATRIFHKVGFQHASTNHIADAAGVSIGSLYQYFPNKLALLATVRSRIYGEFYQRMSGALTRGWSLPFAQAVRETVATSAGFHAEYSSLVRSFLTEIPSFHSSHEEAVRLDWYQGVQRGFIEHHRACLRVGLEEAAFFTRSAGCGVMHSAVMHHPESLRDGTTARQLAEAFLIYLTGAPE